MRFLRGSSTTMGILGVILALSLGTLVSRVSQATQGYSLKVKSSEPTTLKVKKTYLLRVVSHSKNSENNKNRIQLRVKKPSHVIRRRQERRERKRKQAEKRKRHSTPPPEKGSELGGGGSVLEPFFPDHSTKEPSPPPPKNCEPLCNRFPPRRPEFIRNKKPQATEIATNKDWLSLSTTERGNYIMKSYTEILKRKKYTCNYSPRILTCKAFRESLFHPQWQTAVKRSTASGLAQITRSTMQDMVDRYDFRTIIPGHEHLTKFEDFWTQQKSNMLLQMDLSLGF